MVINTLADAKFTGNHHTADFGPQFLFSIGNGTERPEFTVQTRFMASPVRKFMKGCRIIPFLTRKLLFFREINSIFPRPVESVSLCPMDKFYTGRLKDIFRPLHVRPYSFLIGYQGGQSVDLLCVKHIADKATRTLKLHRFLERFSILIINRLAVLTSDRSLLLNFPINYGGSPLSLANLCLGLLRLTVGHPTGIAVLPHHQL